MNITTTALQQLCDIALLAGNEIMAVYAKPDFNTQLKSDNSPLTEADLRADKVIRQSLEKAFPDVFILSEESSSGQLVATDTFFLVDPLDGTKEFIKRNGEFTVNIALINHNKPIAGVVYAPALDELFYAAQGLGAWKISAGSKTQIKTKPSADNAILKVMGSRSHDIEKVEAWLESLGKPYEFTAVGSSLKFCRIAEGKADVYPRFGLTSQWDTAAAQGILEVAGGQVLDLEGNPLCYGLERSILNPEFIAQGSLKYHY